MRPDDSGSGIRNLEEAFFAEQNSRLLEELRQKAEQEERRELLRKVVRIHDDAFLDRLIALDIGPERAMALRLIPLVFIAWVDGSIDAKEKEAVLDAARKQGIAAEKMAAELLDKWLVDRPAPRMLEMWKEYIRQIWPCFTPDEQWQMKENLLGAAREVAQAAGGFLGLGNKISKEEQALLDELASVVD